MVPTNRRVTAQVTRETDFDLKQNKTVREKSLKAEEAKALREDTPNDSNMNQVRITIFLIAIVLQDGVIAPGIFKQVSYGWNYFTLSFCATRN